MAVVAACIVGLVFVVAAVLKFADRTAWRTQSSALGVPHSVADVVPVVELSVGSALLAQLARPVTAAIAGAVVLAFTMVVLHHMRGDARPPCACFGRRHATPIGWRDVVRNVVLLGCCLVAAIA